MPSCCKEGIKRILEKDQVGFKPVSYCIDLINTLCIIIEHYAEFLSPLYILFVDFERVLVFDTLNHDHMWTILQSYIIPSEILNNPGLVPGCYKEVHNGAYGREINVGAGMGLLMGFNR